MTAPTISSLVATVGGSSISGTISGTTITLDIPAGATVTAVPTTITAEGATGITANGSAFTNGGNIDYSSSVTLVVTDGTDSTTYTVTTTTVDKVSTENINMAGWFKVKVVKLVGFDYAAGGFVPPYKAKAVLAVNGAGGLTGYVNPSTGKVMVYAGTSEFSGELTADVYLLIA